jgi:hypothetical protein
MEGRDEASCLNLASAFNKDSTGDYARRDVRGDDARSDDVQSLCQSLFQK